MRTIALLIAAAALAVSASASASSPEEIARCLVTTDVPCAERAADAIGAWTSSDPRVRALAADVHFHAGRYPEAYEAMKAAVDLGFPDPHDNLGLYERTLHATANWVEEERGRFRIRWRPGLDDLLVDDAATALQLAERHIAPLLGGPPPGVTLLEIFPDARSFTAASSLMRSDVENTGVVALSKWSRLLVTSPRALPRGYDWADTIAHEYIHLVVSHRGNGRQSVPVWMQEGIAKYLDSRWRDGKDHFQLTVHQQGLLAEALRDDDLVSFDEMHPSLAKLPSADRAALAYAQLATLFAFAFERGGDDVLLRVLPMVRAGADPREALAESAGFVSFEQFERAWRAWVERLELVQRRLAALPVQLDGGDELDLDPVLAEREDLQRYVTLGNLLADRNFHEAALIEYARAVPANEPAPPVLALRMAESHIALKQPQSAMALLESSRRDYPQFPRTHVLLGRLHESAGRALDALRSFEAAVALNPFDPEVQEALARLYDAQGDRERAARHRRYLAIRASGGDDVQRTPIHQHEGEIVVPDYDAVDHARRAIGRPAQAFEVPALDGSVLRLSDHRGKVVVVDFWATWCGPCREMMPHLSQLQQRRGAEGLVVIGLTDEEEAKVAPFLRKNPVSYAVGIGAADVHKAWGVSSLPTAFVVGRDGKVVDAVVGGGEAAKQRLEAIVDRALSR